MSDTPTVSGPPPTSTEGAPAPTGAPAAPKPKGKPKGKPKPKRDKRTTTNKDTNVGTTDTLKDHKDKDGNLIDPPVLPEYEQRLTVAHDSGDDLLIQEITEEYATAREEHVRKSIAREKRRQS